MVTNDESTETPSPFYKKWGALTAVFVTIAILPLFLIYDRPLGSALDAVKDTRALTVLTINSPTTYYEGPEHALGLEYDLASGLAKKLRVDLVMETADSVASIFPRLARGDAYFAAAGLIDNEERRQLVRFTPPYQQIEQQVVYLHGGKQPETVTDLLGRQITVVAGSSVAHHLSELKAKLPDLAWTETSEKNAEQLLYDVWQGALDLAITDSNIIAVARQYYPELRVGFNINESGKLAWAFPLGDDDSIYDIATTYLGELEESGELERLRERYYGTAESYNYINISEYRRKINVTLPLYEKLFREAEEQTGIDWRLLAAVAYQESHWDPDAVSPTGVKGIMQLTQAAADQMHIEDRTNPRQNIMGGAGYLKIMKRKIPERIQEPDRTWFSLAAYNLGFGHFEDARILTQKTGKSPDKWVDVKEFLPLLSEPEWYEQTKYGEARGGEAFAFVTRIRSFYDVLVKISQERDAKASG